MKNMKRVLAVTAAVAMTAAMMPTAVFADDAETFKIIVIPRAMSIRISVSVLVSFTFSSVLAGGGARSMPYRWVRSSESLNISWKC